MRAEQEAVLVGIGTALRDDPRLTVRPVPGRNPLCVVVDSKLRLARTAAVLSTTLETTIIVTTCQGEARVDEVTRLGACVLVLC